MDPVRFTGGPQGKAPAAGRPRPSPWEDRGLLLLSLWAIAVALVYAGKLHRFGPVFANVVDRSVDLVVLAGIVAIAGELGVRIIRMARIPLPGSIESSLVSIGVGMMALSGIALAMGVAGGYRPWVAYALLLGLAAVFAIRRSPRGWWRGGRLRGTAPLLRLSLGALALFTLFFALTPPTAEDALSYHLAIPRRYIEAKGIVPVPESIYASFPMNQEMLYTLALLLRGPILAQLLHWAMGIFAVGMVYVLAGERTGGRSGFLGAAIFASAPSVAIVATWAYVDLALVFYVLLALAAFRRHARGAPGWLVLCGAFAGAAAGTKYNGALVGLFLLPVILWRARGEGLDLTGALRRVGVFGGVAALVVSPWLIRNTVYTGNPVFPFLWPIFGGQGWDAERDRVLLEFLKGWGRAGNELLLPWSLTMDADFGSIRGFDGVIGPTFLMAIPFILVPLWVARTHRWILVIGWAFAGSWLLLTRQIRFLLPALACFSIVIPGGLVHCFPRPRVGRWARGVLGLGIALNLGWVFLAFVVRNPLPVALGLESRHRYLERALPGGDYAVFRHIAEHLDTGSHILFGACGNPGFICARDYHADGVVENHTLRLLVREGGDPAGIRRGFRRRGFTHILFRWDLVFGPHADLTVEERRSLGAFLNRHGKLEIQAGGTYLYRIDLDGKG